MFILNTVVLMTVEHEFEHAWSLDIFVEILWWELCRTHVCEWNVLQHHDYTVAIKCITKKNLAKSQNLLSKEI